MQINHERSKASSWVIQPPVILFFVMAFVLKERQINPTMHIVA